LKFISKEKKRRLRENLNHTPFSSENVDQTENALKVVTFLEHSE